MTLAITVDTREQRAFSFRSLFGRASFRLHRRGLREGDYAVDSMLHLPPEHQIRIERKSLRDLYGSVSRGRDRVERELDRLSVYGFAAIVVEADWTQIFKPPFETKVHPRSVFATLVAWMQRYNVHVCVCPTRRFAEQMTFRLLERWAKDYDTNQETSRRSDTCGNRSESRN